MDIARGGSLLEDFANSANEPMDLLGGDDYTFSSLVIVFSALEQRISLCGCATTIRIAKKNVLHINI